MLVGTIENSRHSLLPRVSVHPNGGVFNLSLPVFVTFSVTNGAFNWTNFCFAWRTNPSINMMDDSEWYSVVHEPGTLCQNSARAWLPPGKFRLEFGLALQNNSGIWQMRTAFTTSDQFVVRGVDGPTISPSGGDFASRGLGPVQVSVSVQVLVLKTVGIIRSSSGM